LTVAERQRREGHDARAADASVEGRPLVGPVQLAPQRGREAPRPARAERLPKLAERYGERGLGRPEVPGACVRVPEDLRDEAHRGLAVRHRMMDLPDDADVSVGHPLDHVEGPERTGALEPLLHHARDHAPQSVLGDRLWQGQRAHVLADVECGVVDPRRVAPSPARAQLAAKPRSAPDPLGDASTERLGIRSRRVFGRMQDRDFQSVARDRPGLEPQDLEVVRSQRLDHRLRWHLVTLRCSP
jgi:hypothetical protein